MIPPDYCILQLIISSQNENKSIIIIILVYHTLYSTLYSVGRDELTCDPLWTNNPVGGNIKRKHPAMMLIFAWQCSQCSCLD